MAQFIAVIQGGRGAASRLGSKQSGIDGHIRGWTVGGRVSGWFNSREDRDEFDIALTNGSNGGGRDLHLVHATEVNGEVRIVGGVVRELADLLEQACRSVVTERLDMLEGANALAAKENLELEQKIDAALAKVNGGRS